MSYRVVSLNEIADINPKTDIKHLCDDSLVTVLPMSSVSEEGIIKEHQTSTLSNIKKGLTLFKENDVLLAKITPCMENGKRTVAKELQNGIGFGSTEFHVIRTKQEVLPEFVYYLISQNSFRKEAELNMTGSAGQKRVPSSFLKTVKVSLPPIEEQKKIISALAEADTLIQKRKEAIAKLDGLVESVFIDLLGEGLKMEWKKLTLDEVCAEIYRYPTFYGLEYKPSGIPVIRIGNISNSGIVDPDLQNYVFIDEEVSLNYPRTIIELHDIVMAVRGDGSTAKKIGYINSDKLVNANISPNVLRFKADIKITNPLFLFYYLTSDVGQIELNSYVKRTAKKNITATDIKGISIPVPPLDIQQTFTNFAEAIAKQREQMIIQLAKLEENFQSLSHQAFTGRLQFRDSKVDEYALKR